MRSLNLFQGTAKFQNVLLKELLNILQKNRSLESCALSLVPPSPTLQTDNSENIDNAKMLATDFSSLNLDSGF